MSAPVVHWLAARRDRLFAGAACDAAGGRLDADVRAVTCGACLRIWREAATPALPGLTVAPAAARPVAAAAARPSPTLVERLRKARHDKREHENDCAQWDYESTNGCEECDRHQEAVRRLAARLATTARGSAAT